MVKFIMKFQNPKGTWGAGAPNEIDRGTKNRQLSANNLTQNIALFT